MTDRIEKTVDINAPVEKVWRALTDHEAFGQWFGVKLDGPFIPGEPSTGHMTIKGFEHVRWTARIQKIEPQRLFSYTWHPYAIEPGVDYSGEIPTLVEFTLAPVPGGTRLVVTETGFGTLPPHRYPDALRMNDKGWGFQVQNIKTYAEQDTHAAA